ncbi:unnamed protein product [Paramecium pentaurelia]|uniref:Transmembrane protein n=1 Tax=Paramecium pentaurelia TaxID=43138 RepID=A0A8S1W7K0_9CILI|nr:unnamed protein product [Paramecium pentaurelia]
MIIEILALSIVLIKGTECILQKQSCKNLNTKLQCENTDNPYLKCSWNGLCISQFQNSCYQFYTELDCQRNYQYQSYVCYWKDGECLKRNKPKGTYDINFGDKTCEDIDNYSQCSNQIGIALLCAWNHNHCQTIQKCSQITSFQQCRNAKIRDRCQYVVNNIASNQQMDQIFATDIFDYKTCRNQDCLFNTNSDCPAFRNGRRCFLKEGKCTQCSYQTNRNDCIATNKCTWQNSECSNIICSSILSKKLCNSIRYCQYDFTTQSCQNNNKQQLSHCYNYNISSDPIKTKYNSFI